MLKKLSVGDRSPRVAEVRATLARLGRNDAFEAPLGDNFRVEETLFDDQLSDLLRAFQQSRGILATGMIDEPTLRALREASYTLGTRVLNFIPGREMVGDDVVQLQTQLQELGFYADKVDGHYDDLTYEAVKSYQLNSGITEDGICGPETVRALSLLGRHITGGNPLAIREREVVRNAGPLLSGKRVVIDPGLGGENKGLSTEGKFGRITEEEILWDLATRIEGRMVSAGMETILSRPRVDDPTESGRADVANAFNADVMISLRLDRYHNDKAHGCATFYFGSPHGASSLTGEMLSGYIQREIVARTDLGNCRNHARTWELLRLTKMPTVQVMAGYVTNSTDMQILTDPVQRNKIAEAVVVAVKRLYLLDNDDQPTGTFTFSKLLEQEGIR
ncbi:MAG: N-acetylmuramoyl-L-alanine amidase [Corynebacterium pyruviciproducens]|uniref:N-acetylmuramoyl-L-alanine amidase n=1 Tax=Corynebacterium pyruviciproducens TaxID=598660 RepID=UPI0039836DCD